MPRSSFGVPGSGFDRWHELLAKLEQDVIADGVDPDILAAIERERRRAFD